MSLVRTVLWIKFPANREKYREIHKFGLKIWVIEFSMSLNLHELLPFIINSSSAHNRELSPTYQGIAFPDIGLPDHFRNWYPTGASVPQRSAPNPNRTLFRISERRRLTLTVVQFSRSRST